MVDLNNFHLRKEIPLDAAPAAVVADPARPRAFALAPEAGTVYEIDALTLQRDPPDQGGQYGAGDALCAKPGAVWVLARDPSALVEIPLRMPARAAAFPVPAGDIFAVDKLGHAAAANWREHSLALVSLEHGKVERTVGTRPSLPCSTIAGTVKLC